MVPGLAPGNPRQSQLTGPLTLAARLKEQAVTVKLQLNAINEPYSLMLKWLQLISEFVLNFWTWSPVQLVDLFLRKLYESLRAQAGQPEDVRRKTGKQ